MHVQNGDLRIPQIDDRFIQRTMQIKIPGDRILVATIRQRNSGVRLDGISGKDDDPRLDATIAFTGEEADLPNRDKGSIIHLRVIKNVLNLIQVSCTLRVSIHFLCKENVHLPFGESMR